MLKLSAGLLLILAAGIFVLEFGCRTICDGGFDLAVVVRSKGTEPIKEVRYEVFPDTKSLNFDPAEISRLFTNGYFKDRAPSGRPWQVLPDFFQNDRPFSVMVPSSWHISMLLERELSYAQYRTLIIGIQYRNGSHAGKLIEIPDGRGCRSVTVEFP